MSRDFVPEHICRACYRVVARGEACASCAGWHERWNAVPYTLDAILRLQPGWWR